MQGPTQPWDQSLDPRESTVSMPRVDPARLSDQASGSAATAYQGRAAGLEPPGLGDPYALPAPAPEPAPAAGPEPASERTTGADPSWPEDHAASAAPVDPPERPATAAPVEPPERPPTAAPVEPPERPATAAPVEPPERPPTAAPVEPPERPATAAPVDPPERPPTAALVDLPGLAPSAAPSQPPEDAAGTQSAAPVAAEAAPAGPQSPWAPEVAGTQVAASAAASRPAGAQMPPMRAVAEGPIHSGDAPSPAPAAPPAGSWPRADGRTEPALGPRQASAEQRRQAEPLPAERPASDVARARPAAGSVAELRARLARLPDGHPSSPYDDAGRPRPAPTRLRHLELGLPARSGGYADRFGFDADDELDGAWPGTSRPPVARTWPAAPSAGWATDTERADRGPAGEPSAAREPPSEPGPGAAASAASAAEAAVEPPAGSPPAPDEHGGVRDRAARDAGLAGGDAAPGHGQNGHGDSPAYDAGPVSGDTPPRHSQNGHRDGGAHPAWQHPYAVPGERDQPGNGSGGESPAGMALAPWPGGGQPRLADDRNGYHRGGSAPAVSPVAPGQPQNGRQGPPRRDRARHDTEQYRTPRQDTPGQGSGPPGRPGRGDRWPEVSQSDPGRLATGQPDMGRRADPGRSERQPPPSGPLPGGPAAASSHPGDRPGPGARRPSAARHEPGQAGRELGPELRQLVDRILAAARAAEGQNALGGYGSSGLTPAMRRLAAQLPAGGLAAGSEADTLKPADRLAAKLTRLIARQPGRSPAELAAGIGDVIRYAFTFPAADYTDGTWLVHRKLKAQGFDLEVRRNRWDSSEYKGVFTRWRDPAHGLPFEVQFHSTDSWAVVKQTHDAYVRITDPATPPAERARLRAHQVAAAAAVQPPPGWADIADFRAEAR